MITYSMPVVFTVSRTAFLKFGGGSNNLKLMKFTGDGTDPIGYNINASTTVQLGYRFFGTADPEFSAGGATQTTEFNSHNLEFGIRIRF